MKSSRLTGQMSNDKSQWEFAGTPIVYTPGKNAPRSCGCRGLHINCPGVGQFSAPSFYRIAEAGVGWAGQDLEFPNRPIYL